MEVKEVSEHKEVEFEFEIAYVASGQLFMAVTNTKTTSGLCRFIKSIERLHSDCQILRVTNKTPIDLDELFKPEGWTPPPPPAEDDMIDLSFLPD